MQSLNSNKQTIHYALYLGVSDIYNGGYKTGEKTKSYATPVEFRCNVSPARGVADTDPFGIATDYDRTMVTCDMSCPIAEDTILWLGTSTSEPYNYKVVRRAESINGLLFAIKEVSKS